MIELALSLALALAGLFVHMVQKYDEARCKAKQAKRKRPSMAEWFRRRPWKRAAAGVAVLAGVVVLWYEGLPAMYMALFLGYAGEGALDWLEAHLPAKG